MLEISAVAPGSIAERLGLKKGDSVESVNRRAVNDAIDYQYLAAEEHITLRVRTGKGKTKTSSIDKDPDDLLGLAFAPLRIKQCRNKCIFCFVDQMPPGCRKSLYVKDDDFRASFLHGNYITLASLTEQDWRRIFDQRLSPLYISVHSTDSALRSFITGNRNMPDILTGLKRLATGGIRMHTQIVLSPGINDGRFLERTLDDLSGFFPAVLSVAVVPVGLTDFRSGLYPLRLFTQREARAVIDMVTRFGSTMKKQYGSRIVFASDEFYIKAKLPAPPASFYEEFPQIENGVGMVADFLRTAARARFPKRISPLKVTLVTGVSFAKALKEAAHRLGMIKGLSFNIVMVRNRFFGASVTVAGLLTGGDIAAALTGKRLGRLVIVPAETLKQEDNLFLDGMRLDHLERILGTRVIPAASLKDVASILRAGGG